MSEARQLTPEQLAGLRVELATRSGVIATHKGRKLLGHIDWQAARIEELEEIFTLSEEAFKARGEVLSRQTRNHEFLDSLLHERSATKR